MPYKTDRPAQLKVTSWVSCKKKKERQRTYYCYNCKYYQGEGVGAILCSYSLKAKPSKCSNCGKGLICPDCRLDGDKDGTQKSIC